MNSDVALLLETANFAAEKHRYQRRKDPEQTPYINHPLGKLKGNCLSLNIMYTNQNSAKNKSDFDFYLGFEMLCYKGISPRTNKKLVN